MENILGKGGVACYFVGKGENPVYIVGKGENQVYIVGQGENVGYFQHFFVFPHISKAYISPRVVRTRIV